jgi:hypothetical protein
VPGAGAVWAITWQHVHGLPVYVYVYVCHSPTSVVIHAFATIQYDAHNKYVVLFLGTLFIK